MINLEELFEECSRNINHKVYIHQAENKENVEDIINEFQNKLLDFIAQNRVTEYAIPEIESIFGELKSRIIGLNDSKVEDIINEAHQILGKTKDSTQEALEIESKEERQEEIGSAFGHSNMGLEAKKEESFTYSQKSYVEDSVKEVYNECWGTLRRTIQNNPVGISSDFIEELQYIIKDSCKENIEELVKYHDESAKNLVESLQNDFQELGQTVIERAQEEKEKEVSTDLPSWDLRNFNTSPEEVNGKIKAELLSRSSNSKEIDSGEKLPDLPSDAIR